MTSQTELPKLLPGQKLAGCYLLDHDLQAGTEFPVWIAQDEVLGKEVSLHFLPPAVSQDAAALEELRQEIKRNRPLIHPSVLRVYDLVDGDGWAAVAMETFHGRSLAAVLREKGRFECAELDDWLDEICVALEEAHRIKLTHRDLAPENIFVTEHGRLLVANFAIGRIVQDALAKGSPTASVLARFSNISPQLLEGTAPAPADDVYGIGALFFQLLAGRPVFEGGDILSQVRHAVPPRLSQVRDNAERPGAPIEPGWENVIAACLNKLADERPDRPAEVVSSIDAYVAHVPGAPAEPEIQREESVETVADLSIDAMPHEPELMNESHPASAAPSSTEPASELRPTPIEPDDTNPEPEPETRSLVSAEADQPATISSESPAEGAVVEPADELPHENKRAAEESKTEPSAETLTAVTSSEELPTDAPIAPAPEPTASPTTAASHRPPPAQPQRYYEDEDALSPFLPKRYRFPVAVVAAVALILFLINGFFKKTDEGRASAPRIAAPKSGDRSELTSVKNPVRESAGPTESAVTAQRTQSSAVNDVLVAAATTPRPKKAETAVTPTPTSALPAGPKVSEKAAELEKFKAALAESERALQAHQNEQMKTAAALADAQKSLDEKTAAAASVKKAAAEVNAARKKRQEEQKAAETAAVAAQELAAEKVRAAEEAKKALADFEAKNGEKLSAQDKIEAEIKALEQNLADRKKAADDAAKAATESEQATQQKTAAVKAAEQEVALLQANAARNSAEEAQRRQAMESEKSKLDDEISAMRALFEQKMKDIEDRRRQLDRGAAAPAASANTAPAPTMPAVKPPTPTAPSATPILVAKTEPTKAPALPVTTPAPTINPAAGGGANSLGMRFAPVGDVQFAIWQTRVKDFEAYAKAVNLKSTAWRGPGFRQGPDHPVVNVTWTEAIGFCKWLTEKEHKEGSLAANLFYRLPYDLEWSRAVGLPDESGRTPEARDMGVPDVYPWGTEWPPTKGAGNYTGEETGSDVAIKGYDDGFAWTAPVGSFPPNKLGLYDMGGNVWQWCMDSWNNESKAKVLRGASWYNGALKLSLLSSCRIQAAPDSSTDNYGFRFVRATENVTAKGNRR